MQSILIAGVDLGTTKTCAVIAEVHEDPCLRRDLKILGVGQAPSLGMRDIVDEVKTKRRGRIGRGKGDRFWVGQEEKAPLLI